MRSQRCRLRCRPSGLPGDVAQQAAEALSNLHLSDEASSAASSKPKARTAQLAFFSSRSRASRACHGCLAWWLARQASSNLGARSQSKGKFRFKGLPDKGPAPRVKYDVQAGTIDIGGEDDSAPCGSSSSALAVRD